MIYTGRGWGKRAAMAEHLRTIIRQDGGRDAPRVLVLTGDRGRVRLDAGTYLRRDLENRSW